MTTFTPGTLHPTNRPDPRRLWRIKLQLADMQARTYQQKKDTEWIRPLLSTLAEINALAASFGPFEPVTEKEASGYLAPSVDAGSWYADLTRRLADIFGSVPYVLL